MLHVRSITDKDKLPQSILLLLLIVFSAVIVYCLCQTLDWRISWDTPTIHYTAWRILEGDRLYTDIFDVDLPGSHLIHMLSIILLGKSDLGFRMFDLLWVCFIVASIYVFFPKTRRRAASAASLSFLACYLAGGEPNMQEREILMLPFLILSLHFLRISIDDGKKKIFTFFSGFFLGFSVFIKPFPLILLGIYLVILVARSKKGAVLKTVLSLYSSLGGGFLTPLLLIHLWLWRMDAVHDFYKLIFVVLFRIYPHLYRIPFSMIFSRFLLWTAPALPVLFGVFLIKKKDLRLTLLLVGSLYGVLHYFIQNKGFSQHIYIVISFFIFAGFYASDLLLESINRPLRYLSVALVTVTFMLLSPLYLIDVDRLKRSDLFYVKSAINDLTPLVTSKNELQPLDDIDGLANAMYRMNLRIPARYLHSYPLFFKPKDSVVENYIKILKADFLYRLSEEKVRIIIIDVDNIHLMGDSFPELAVFLEKNYSLHLANNLYHIYLMRQHPNP